METRFNTFQELELYFKEICKQLKDYETDNVNLVIVYDNCCDECLNMSSHGYMHLMIGDFVCNVENIKGENLGGTHQYGYLNINEEELIEKIKKYGNKKQETKNKESK